MADRRILSSMLLHGPSVRRRERGNYWLYWLCTYERATHCFANPVEKTKKSEFVIQCNGLRKVIEMDIDLDSHRATLERGADIDTGSPLHMGVSSRYQRKPSWDEYVAAWGIELQPYINGVRECIERDGLVGSTAKNMADDSAFVFEDGARITFSWRGWGDLMQAVVNKREGYMAYYM